MIRVVLYIIGMGVLGYTAHRLYKKKEDLDVMLILFAGILIGLSAFLHALPY